MHNIKIRKLEERYDNNKHKPLLELFESALSKFQDGTYADPYLFTISNARPIYQGRRKITTSIVDPTNDILLNKILIFRLIDGLEGDVIEFILNFKKQKPEFTYHIVNLESLDDMEPITSKKEFVIGTYVLFHKLNQLNIRIERSPWPIVDETILKNRILNYLKTEYLPIIKQADKIIKDY